MATLKKVSEVKNFQIANNLAETSTLLLALRIHGRATLSPDQKKDILELEDCLNELVARYQAHGIDLIAENARKDVDEATDAIEEAQGRLAKIQNIKHAIDIAAAIVNVGAALLLKDPIAVAEAAKKLADINREDKAKAG